MGKKIKRNIYFDFVQYSGPLNNQKEKLLVLLICQNILEELSLERKEE